jgi:ankyrin repeat protein
MVFPTAEALHVAISHHDLPAIRRLVNQGCDPNEVHLTERTPLTHAARLGNPNSAQLLVSFGADVNFHDQAQSGKTALHEAAGSGHAAMVQTLVTLGADVNACDNLNATALKHASRRGHANTVRTLVQLGAELHPSCDPWQQTALMAAARHGW